METLAVLSLNLWSVLGVVLGLGLVIFFHELGHFAVAKWCDVNVERFSIGFGPILLRLRRGETEYVLSAIPFGGYVKMLGQDDIDPSQLTSEEIAQDPRSYSAKPVWQRMAIISAGVTMNVITAGLFFAIAMRIGIETPPPEVGMVLAGMPAWKAGIERGDRIDRMDGWAVSSFNDVRRRAALSSGSIEISGVHSDGRTFTKTLKPDTSGRMPIIGVEPMNSLKLLYPNPKKKDAPPVAPGTPAAAATPPFMPNDVIRKIDETPIDDYVKLRETLALKSSKAVDYYVKRSTSSGNELVRVHVEPNAFRTLGLWMDIGPIAAVRDGSPAAVAGLKEGDKIVRVDGLSVGTDINPMRLPDYFAKRKGQEVVVEVSRVEKGGTSTEIRVPVQPQNAFAWIEPPVYENAPVCVPSIGAAFDLTSTVLKVEAGSPAAEAGVQPRARIKRVEFFRAQADQDADADIEPKDKTIKWDEKSKNWAYAFWSMQNLPRHNVRLTFTGVSDSGSEERTVELAPRSADGWFLAIRGTLHAPLLAKQKAGDLSEAITMAFGYTVDSLSDIYLTLRNLIVGFLSIENVQGPIGIAQVAYTLAEQGLADLLMFLGFLSVNLAVLNFLPIPVLDGGHMVFLIWEGVARRRPSERVVVTATYFGIAFVLGLVIFVVYQDIFVHLKVFG